MSLPVLLSVVEGDQAGSNVFKEVRTTSFPGYPGYNIIFGPPYLVQNRNNDSIHKSGDDESKEEDDDESEDEVDYSQKEDDVKSESDESELEEEYYAHIIDLDNVTEQRRPPFCFAKECIFCLENRPEYFAKRPQTEATFRVRFIEPIIEPFIFIFKDLIDMTWGEITSLSSANRRNHRLAKGTGSKQMHQLDFRLGRHPEGDKCKLDRCLVDVLNNLFYDYNVCEFELAKKLKVFGLQTKGYNCIISELYIFGRGIYCIRKLSQFPLPTRISDLCYLYELLRAMFLLRDELIKSLRVIQDLKIAKARKLEVIKPFSSYILRIPPS
ncbi:hypothetical protein GLOIN_2v1476342 [Rhizophagus irregularis DAOM 181602=DAOM 197198]|uniref:Uncharacterized protein n=1 Tax=Rhizophagus irregularis (strain DAOM 181602 / DAOM 197198 / MUCL 43194) TaxID=747089 RepID=A0A2P4Q949_RHIID|nr:hypothetical protein GLOIN_2v1476342 [Rhizophagus irregularis DAOM 181602=DAOM 197198]POG74156.1 hypothetical protein GLOIN_2v1476342 [Rhizophagus irregularis DAOM 181602=DAOM 197198]|eukprot:XP_025181022.1 hypothetical protein GLOIN_2v1476342 [Rhizophagus irregularis DAOM 181602=DAOM 197198]